MAHSINFEPEQRRVKNRSDATYNLVTMTTAGAREFWVFGVSSFKTLEVVEGVAVIKFGMNDRSVNGSGKVHEYRNSKMRIEKMREIKVFIKDKNKIASNMYTLFVSS